MENRFVRFGLPANPSVYASESWNKFRMGAEYHTDATLCLESPGASSSYNSIQRKRKWADFTKGEGFEHASLTLGLGHSPSSSESSKRSSATICTMSSAKERDEETSIDLDLNFELCLGNDSTSNNKPYIAASELINSKRSFDLNLSLSTGTSESVITNATSSENLLAPENSSRSIVDEGSTSSRWKFGAHLFPSQRNPDMCNRFLTSLKIPTEVELVPDNQDLSSTMTQKLKTPVSCSSGVKPQHRSINTKICQFPGCVKGARGASGCCIAHGGGRRCQKEGCHKGAEGRTIYCKAHGGGRRCEFLGCTKSAEGRTDFCIAHGGGRRCSHEGCTRAARGKSGLCIRHGGGKRCQRENCTKSAEGYSGLCISHGGGRRCQFNGCTKGAQGSTMFCKAHGGGKRCNYLGCTKGAEGSTPFCKGHGGGKRCAFQGGSVCPKSVHGGTQFCVAHGGGKRCAFPDCTKSARGRTSFCVRHGGGKRCKSEGCGKSAQGSTDFCKAHGGGKRCTWGQPGSALGSGSPPCDRFARGKDGLCASHSGLLQDNRVHGGGAVGSLTGANVNANSIASTSEVNDTIGHTGHGLRQWSNLEQNSVQAMGMFPHPSAMVFSLPEGRVHGGSLLAVLAAGGGLGSQVEGQPEQHEGLTAVAHKWM